MHRPKHVILVSALAVAALTSPSACARRRRNDDNTPAPLQPVAQPPAHPAVAPAQPSTAQPAAPPAAQPAPPSAPAAVAPAGVTFQRSIVLGRWPEGLSARGNEACVAESGDRTIAHVDLTTGAVLDRTRSGRLPVRVHVAGDGSVQVVSATDKTVWAQPPGASRATRLARLPDDPQDAVWADDGALWTLLWHRGSSASGSVARVSAGDRSATEVAPVGANAMSLAVGHGKVWVARADGVDVIDVATGRPLPPVALPGHHPRIAACARGVYVNDGDSIVRIDPATSAVSGRQALEDGARTFACATDGALWAVGSHGRVSRLDPVSLAVVAATAPPTAFEPAAAQVAGGRLLVTTHALGGSDAAGALVVFGAP